MRDSQHAAFQEYTRERSQCATDSFVKWAQLFAQSCHFTPAMDEMSADAAQMSFPVLISEPEHGDVGHDFTSKRIKPTYK